MYSQTSQEFFEFLFWHLLMAAMMVAVQRLSVVWFVAHSQSCLHCISGPIEQDEENQGNLSHRWPMNRSTLSGELPASLDNHSVSCAFSVYMCDHDMYQPIDQTMVSRDVSSHPLEFPSPFCNTLTLD
jgi:hypothetical protein